MSGKVIIRSPEELPPVPCTLGGMEWNPTGLWRYLTPNFKEKAAPCAAACPAGNPIARIMALMAEGREREALEALLEVNPLPGVTGRLCYHPCQKPCLRRQVDRALPVQLLERWAADHGQARPARRRLTGPDVAVIGAGPAGLTCAYLLARRGCRVTLWDPAPEAGGFLRGTGGLPAAVLKREIGRLQALSGVLFALGGECGPREVLHCASPPALVVLDDRAHPAKSPEALRVADAWEGGGAAEAGGAVLRPDADQGFKGYKPSQVAHAVGLGRELAERAAALLEGRDYQPPEPLAVVGPDEVRAGRFMPEKPPHKPPTRLDAQRARNEAARCMSCGACNLCQQCVLFCPDACLGLSPDSKTVQVDLEHCKGCGICAQECPRGVIDMEATS